MVNYSDQVELQDNINTLTDWSIISDLKFYLSKSVHLSVI